MKNVSSSLLFALPLVITVAGLAQTFTLDTTPNPSGSGSLQPNWSVTQDGSPLLSWIEAAKDGSYSLRYAVRHGSVWSEARTVVAHRHFFRHPAEVPEIIAAGGGVLLAHWIETPQTESEAEYVYVSASSDGVTWSAPVMASKDHSAVQHGLASMVANGDGTASLTWLQALHGEDAPVSLMRTVVSAEGKALKEEILDPDVCACCPTSVIKTAKGLLIAYRGLTDEGIRDIQVTRFENGHWSSPKLLNPDKWKLNACPTNAASAAANGDHVAIAWYTGAANSPRVQVAFSADSGATFGKPALVSTGHAYGYVSLSLDDDGSALISWLEKGTEATAATHVLFRRIAANGAAGPVLSVDQGSRQSLGYPKIVHAGKETLIAWGTRKPSAKIVTALLKK
jgi:hypothetical protein